MVFANAINSSNNDFELSTGTNQFANRDRLQGGYPENIGINLTLGTFTVQGGDGNSLTATNPGYINLQSKLTPGKQIKVKVTANQSFTAASIAGQRFGLTAGISTTVDMPFYLYAVVDDTETTISFMVSRINHAFVAPATTKIGRTGAVTNLGQGDFFAFGAINVGDYDGNPCLCIGSFRTQFDGGTNSWTVQTLTAQDGIGNFQEGVFFLFPRGQFGAAAGKVYADNGGTAPDDPTGNYGYSLTNKGQCFLELAFPNITVAGVGAVPLKLAVPFVSGATSFILVGYELATGVVSMYMADIAGGQTLTNTTLYMNTVGSGAYTNAIIIAGAVVAFRGSYLIGK
jgi:hypothetical protein